MTDERIFDGIEAKTGEGSAAQKKSSIDTSETKILQSIDQRNCAAKAQLAGQLLALGLTQSSVEGLLNISLPDLSGRQ